MTVDTAALTPAEIEAELQGIISALRLEVDPRIADDVYLRVRELIRQAALPLEAERERVRVLREALEGVRPCLMEAMRYGGGRYGKEHAAMDAALGAEMDREEAALAAAKGES